jgi:diguanylate cyclase (GGDEF)-like protein
VEKTIMSVMIRENFLEILQEQRERLHGFDLQLRPLAESGDLDAIFSEFALQRASISQIVKVYSFQLNHEQLIELHSQMIEELENHLSAVIKSFIENRIQSITELAEQDPLTTLLNRSAFDRRLSDEVERARRYHRELSVALLDVDRFKSVNDRFGHPVGDQVLLQVASILQSSLRQSDATFRYGGDEFAAVCPETSGDDMHKLLYRIEVRFKEYCVAAHTDPLTGISWGVASLPTDAMEAGELVRIADRRLYDCKKEHHRLLTSIGDQREAKRAKIYKKGKKSGIFCLLL